MTTLFDNTGLPLWVYIVIIAVGSTVLLATVAVALRCWVLRRRAKKHQGSDGLTGGPMRRLTVRRGRVVPSSQHLSLTGSKFGVRQFGILADNESTMTGRKSPFEWWNTIMDRSQSRQDQMSQVETGSIMTRPGSRANTVGGRREMLHGTPSQTPEKNKEPVTKTWELTIPSPTHSPTPSPLGPNRSTNFSRSFSNRAPSSPLTQRSQVTLSRISERSPHQSMISTANGPAMSSQNRSSHHTAINPVDNTPLPGQAPQPSPTTPRKSMTLVPPPPRSRPTSQRPSPQQDARSSSQSRSTSSKRRSQRDASSSTGSRLTVPKPAALPMSSSTPQLILPDFGNTPITNSFYRQPNPSRPDVSRSRRVSNTSTPTASTTNLSRKSSSSIGPSGTFCDTQVPRSQAQAGYWSSRTDLHASPSAQRKSSSGTPRSGHSRNPSTDQPRRSRYSTDEENGGVQENSMGILTVPGKNNQRVLRKKSLKRMQVVSSLGV